MISEEAMSWNVLLTLLTSEETLLEVEGRLGLGKLKIFRISC